MANGVTIPDVSVQPIPARMLGLRSLITSFFESTEAQPEYKKTVLGMNPLIRMQRDFSACTTRMFMAFLATM
jgi:hypothetical protein